MNLIVYHSTLYCVEGFCLYNSNVLRINSSDVFFANIPENFMTFRQGGVKVMLQIYIYKAPEKNPP
jgi:hypothetical protein